MNDFAVKVFSFYVDDDPNIPQDYLNSFAHSIGGKTYCVENAGHFNSKAGYLKCDVVLDAIKECF